MHNSGNEWKLKNPTILLGFFCGVGRDRTGDTRIFSPLLYRLSYRTFAKASVRGAHLTLLINAFRASPAVALA